MSQISSINFKKSIAINTAHNDRTLPPSYLIDNEKGAEYNRSADEARNLKNQIIKEAIENYTERTGQKFQAKSYEWSAVCNIKPDTTMQDLEALAKHFNDKYGFQCYQIAIHRDEGHIDENGQKQINHHAHLEFITLDKNTGTNNYRRGLITPKILRQIQSETAQILQMQRGQDKRKSGRQRIEPRKYAQMKEQEKAKTKELQQKIQEQTLNNKQLKELLEVERKTFIAENERLKLQQQEALYNAEDYKRLRELNKQQDITIQELKEQIEQIKKQAIERSKGLEFENTEIKKHIQVLENKKLEQEKTIQELKTEIAHNRTEMGQISTNAIELREIIVQANEVAQIASIELEANETPKKKSFWDKIKSAYTQAMDEIDSLLNLDSFVRDLCARFKIALFFPFRVSDDELKKLNKAINDIVGGKEMADDTLAEIENELGLEQSETYTECKENVIKAIKELKSKQQHQELSKPYIHRR